MKDCVFCNYKMPEQVLASTKHFYAVPALGQITDGGHIIVTSKKHYSCLGEMSTPELEEIARFVYKLKGKMRMIYGSVASFEQGVNGQTVNHAHLQIIPIPSTIDVLPLIQRYIPNHIQLENITELRIIHDNYGPYAFYHPQNGLKHAFLSTEQLPDHYLRSIISQALGKQKRADWRLWRNARTTATLDDMFIEKTMKDMKDLLKD